jgi:hypothetical protein
VMAAAPSLSLLSPCVPSFAPAYSEEATLPATRWQRWRQALQRRQRGEKETQAAGKSQSQSLRTAAAVAVVAAPAAVAVAAEL